MIQLYGETNCVQSPKSDATENLLFPVSASLKSPDPNVFTNQEVLILIQCSPCVPMSQFLPLVSPNAVSVVLNF